MGEGEVLKNPVLQEVGGRGWGRWEGRGRGSEGTLCFRR